MSKPPDMSGPQFRADRPVEQEAVRTTIVGGRPPGSGQAIGPIPRGIEVLVKKASIDPAFKQVLLERRAEAAKQIGLELDPAEVMMLGAVPGAQLETIIARTRVPQEHRRAFLGKAAVAMLAAIGVIGAQGCGQGTPKGIRPDRPERFTTTGAEPSRPPERLEPTKGTDPAKPAENSEPKPEGSKPKENTLPPAQGTPEPGPGTANPLRPDRIPVPEGIRPDPPPIRGIRPDRPLRPGAAPDE